MPCFHYTIVLAAAQRNETSRCGLRRPRSSDVGDFMEELKKAKLYEEIAEKVALLIDRGILSAGDRIPSIRDMSRDLGVSINTVKESYWYLENKNYIEAVPQSGYYVRKKTSGKVAAANDLNLNPEEVSLCRIYSAFREKGVCTPSTGLGVALIDGSLWPSKKLYRYHQEALRQHSNEALEYCMAPGYRPLREQIAFHLLRSGVSVAPDEIIVTAGCSEAIFLALSAICSPGDTIAVESPCYFNFLQLCESLSLQIVEVPVAPDGMHLETLAFVLDSYPVKAVITIPSYQNPTGALMGESKRERLVKMLAAREIPLVEDEIYSELYFDVKTPPACKAFDTDGNVLLCSSFSKTIAPGLRVGWIVPGKYYRQLEKFKNQINLGTPALSQIAIARYLADGCHERHLKKTRARLAENMREMRQAVLRHFPEGTSVSDPGGGFVLWVEMPDRVDSLRLYREMLEDEIILAPGCMFSMNSKFRNYLRFNAGNWSREVYVLVEKIGNRVRQVVSGSQ